AWRRVCPAARERGRRRWGRARRSILESKLPLEFRLSLKPELQRQLAVGRTFLSVPGDKACKDGQECPSYSQLAPRQLLFFCSFKRDEAALGFEGRAEICRTADGQ